MISCGWIISHRCSWIMVYVLCCNVQVNLIVIFMTCTCIVMHSLWRDTSSELWIPIHYFRFILPSTASTMYFSQALFTLPQTNIYFHTICLILCLEQTGGIDNLTVSWGKVVWLCWVQVPCCCWC
jgi:hypothetical protein